MKKSQVLLAINYLRAKLLDLIPETFRKSLKESCKSEQIPLKSKKNGNQNQSLLVDARNIIGGLEGFIFVHRVGTIDKPAEKFSNSDKLCLALYGDAIGYTLHKLRIEESTKHPSNFSEKSSD